MRRSAAVVLAWTATVLAQPAVICSPKVTVTETAWQIITTCPCTSPTTTATTAAVSLTTSASGAVDPGSRTLSTSLTTSSLATSTVSTLVSSSSGASFTANPTLIGSSTTSSSLVATTGTGTQIPDPPFMTTSISLSTSVPVASSGSLSASPATSLTTSSGSLPLPTGGDFPLSSLPSDYIVRALIAHNIHRRNHSIPDLVWSPLRAQYAAELAATCVYGHSRAQGDGNYGQNIGAGFLPEELPKMITNNMYNNEIGLYPGPYGSNTVDESNFRAWGHYSQLVWDDTTEVGCATQFCPNGLANTGGNTPPYFTVCNYFPAGNFVGAWSNVAAPGGGPTVRFV